MGGRPGEVGGAWKPADGGLADLPAGLDTDAGERGANLSIDDLMAQGGHYAELYNTYFRHQSLEYIESFVG